MKLVGATDWFIRWPFVIEGDDRRRVRRADRDRGAGGDQGCAARPAGRALGADRGAADDPVRCAARRAAASRASASRRSGPGCRCGASCASDRGTRPGLERFGARATLQSDMRLRTGTGRAGVALALAAGRVADRRRLARRALRLDPVRAARARSSRDVERAAGPGRAGPISKDYYRPVNRSRLVNKGSSSAVASLDDPYSHYFDPPDYKTFHERDPSQHLSGIGSRSTSPTRGLRGGRRVSRLARGQRRAEPGDVITTVGGHLARGPL